MQKQDKCMFEQKIEVLILVLTYASLFMRAFWERFFWNKTGRDIHIGINTNTNCTLIITNCTNDNIYILHLNNNLYTKYR